MRAPAFLFFYATNPDLGRASEIVDAEQRVGYVRFRNPRYWRTSGVSELLQVPGAVYDKKSEEFAFSESKPEVWVLDGSPNAEAIISGYKAVGVPAEIVGAPAPVAAPKKRRSRKKRSVKKASPPETPSEE